MKQNPGCTVSNNFMSKFVRKIYDLKITNLQRYCLAEFFPTAIRNSCNELHLKNELSLITAIVPQQNTPCKIKMSSYFILGRTKVIHISKLKNVIYIHYHRAQLMLSRKKNPQFFSVNTKLLVQLRFFLSFQHVKKKSKHIMRPFCLKFCQILYFRQTWIYIMFCQESLNLLKIPQLFHHQAHRPLPPEPQNYTVQSAMNSCHFM